jgi:hypothetical protein
MTLNDKRQPITRNYERLVVYLPKELKDQATLQAKTQTISTSKYLADIIKGHLDGQQPQ